MGIVPHSLQLLDRYIEKIGGYKNCLMLELGDQQMYCHPSIAEASAAKVYFSSLGVRHVSVDLNGQLGALPMDLSKPLLESAAKGQFDVVTDFGTSEHVGPGLAALYQCRLNVHEACRDGGLMVFMNPKTGHWPGHGFHYFTMRHYDLLASACGYSLLEVEEQPTLGNMVDGWQVQAVLTKGSKPFVSFDEFSAICKDTVFTK